MKQKTNETPKEVLKQAEKLKSKQLSKKMEAIEKLGKINHETAREKLIQNYLKEKNEMVKQALAKQITPKEFIQQIFPKIKQPTNPENIKKAITFGKRR